MFHSSPARWLAAMPALAALAVGAQPLRLPAPPSADKAPTELAFKSALDGYQPYADEKAIAWKDANDTVFRRGGWRAYAKETVDQGITPAAPSPGHAMPMSPKKEQP